MNDTNDKDSREELIDVAEQAKDEGDISLVYGLYEQQKIKREVEELNQPETHPDFDGVNCVDCGYEIQKKRLEMNKVRCVFCQEELDEYNRLRKMNGY